MPLNEEKEIINYSNNLQKKFFTSNLRSKIWDTKTLNYRIRQVHQKKIPYYLVIGQEEVTKKILKLVYTYQDKIMPLTEQQLYDKLQTENENND